MASASTNRSNLAIKSFISMINNTETSHFTSAHYYPLSFLYLESASRVLGLFCNNRYIPIIEVIIDLIGIVIPLLRLILVPLLLKIMPECWILMVGLYLELLIGKIKENCAGEIVDEAYNGLIYGELINVRKSG